MFIISAMNSAQSGVAVKNRLVPLKSEITLNGVTLIDSGLVCSGARTASPLITLEAESSIPIIL